MVNDMVRPHFKRRSGTLYAAAVKLGRLHQFGPLRHRFRIKFVRERGLFRQRLGHSVIYGVAVQNRRYRRGASRMGLDKGNVVPRAIQWQQ